MNFPYQSVGHKLVQLQESKGLSEGISRLLVVGDDGVNKVEL
jgi:hypothetical protein